MKVISFGSLEKLDNGYKIDISSRNEGGMHYYKTDKLYFKTLADGLKHILKLEKEYLAEAELEEKQDEVAVLKTSSTPF